MCRPRRCRPALAACSRACWKSSPCSISVAPSARIAAFFSTELPCGTTMVALRPCRAAARAIDWPWLPRVALITPRTPRLAPQQLVQVDRAAAQLEGAERGVVLVLDADRRAQPLLQQRPADRRRRRHLRAHDLQARPAVRRVRAAGSLHGWRRSIVAAQVAPRRAVCRRRRAAPRPATVQRHAVQAERRRPPASARPPSVSELQRHAAGRQVIGWGACPATRSASAARRRTAAARRRGRRCASAAGPAGWRARRPPPARRRGPARASAASVASSCRAARHRCAAAAGARAAAACRPRSSRPNQRGRAGGGASGSMAMISR